MDAHVKRDPPSDDNEEMFTTSFRLRRSEWAKLQTLAASEHRTASAHLRLLIERATSDDDQEMAA